MLPQGRFSGFEIEKLAIASGTTPSHKQPSQRFPEMPSRSTVAGSAGIEMPKMGPFVPFPFDPLGFAPAGNQT